ncbi:MAG: hypothetical protein ACFFBK_07650, partial [Promethearchaeota archaeon]
ISALQWIYRDLMHDYMQSMLKELSKSFYHILKPNSNIIIQFYPKSKEIMDKIAKTIIKSTDFSGNFIIDNPNSNKKRKIYLLLSKQ